MEHDDWDEEPPRIFFSMTEVFHLLASVAVLTLAFAFVLSQSDGELFSLQFDWDLILSLLPWSALAVVPAFILHELAHKIVAQRKDMWAEFRANFLGLFGGLVLTAFSGFLFAVPGAVHILGHATKRDSGVISIVGPMVNLALGYGAYALGVLFPEVIIAKINFFDLVVLLNVILAAFNMLPVGPLDGRKVWRWSKLGFFGVWAMTLALLLLLGMKVPFS